jgi:4-aminobutyrate aminotransferase-like enzyme
MDFMVGLRHLCDTYDVLLIVDEIFSGFGRTGAWLACDHAKVIPDIVCVGKGMTGGLPAAACVADKTVMDDLVGSGGIPLHGSTFMANPLACAAILATIDVIASESLLVRAEEIGRGLTESFLELMEHYAFIGDVRGLGAAVAIDFVTNRATKEPAPTIAKYVSAALLQRGVTALWSGMPFGNVVTFSPPLVIDANQLEYVVGAVAGALRDTRDRFNL